MVIRSLRWSAVVLLAALVGCGGGGPTTTDPGPIDNNGRVTGTLGAAASGATVRLEGTTQSAICGPDGSFQFDGVPPGEYTVSVETPGGQGGAVTVRVGAGGTIRVPEIPLDTAGQITGLVSDRDSGQPLAGARILARRTPYDDATAGDLPPEVAGGLAGGDGRQVTEPDTAEAPRVTTTAPDGSFRFGGVTPGPYSIEISRDGYEGGETGTYVSPGRTGVADATLRRIDPNNAAVSGTVTSTGGDLPGALARVRVELWPTSFDDQPGPMTSLPEGATDLDSSIDPFYLPPFFEIRSAFTDEHGAYAIRNVPPGEYRMTFRRYGYTDLERTVTLGTAERRTENATLAYRLTTVSGRVMRQTAGGLVAVARAEVWAATWSDEIPLRQDEGGGSGGGSPGTVVYPYPVGPGNAVSDQQGRFSLEAEAGNLSMGAFHPEYGSSYQELTVPLGGASGVTLVLESFDVPPPGGGGDGGGGGTTEPGQPGIGL